MNAEITMINKATNQVCKSEYHVDSPLQMSLGIGQAVECVYPPILYSSKSQVNAGADATFQIIVQIRL